MTNTTTTKTYSRKQDSDVISANQGLIYKGLDDRSQAVREALEDADRRRGYSLGDIKRQPWR